MRREHFNGRARPVRLRGLGLPKLRRIIAVVAVAVIVMVVVGVGVGIRRRS